MRWSALLLLLSGLALAGEEPAPAEADEAAQAEEIVKGLQEKDGDALMDALRAAGTNQDRRLTVPLTRLLKDKNPAVRLAAIEALGLRKHVDEKKKAARALAARIQPLAKKEEDKAELLAVVSALHDLAEPVALDALLDDLPPDADREATEARLHAAGNIPDNKVIEELIRIASAGRRGGANWRRQAALRALRYATQENVGGDVDEWRRWWSDHKATWDPHIAANKRADERLKQQEKEDQRKARREKKKNKDG